MTVPKDPGYKKAIRPHSYTLELFSSNLGDVEKHSHLYGILQNGSAPWGTEALFTPRDVQQNSDISLPIISRVNFSTQTLQFGLGGRGGGSQLCALARIGEGGNFLENLGVKCLMLIKGKGEISECKGITRALGLPA